MLVYVRNQMGIKWQSNGVPKSIKLNQMESNGIKRQTLELPSMQQQNFGKNSPSS